MMRLLLPALLLYLMGTGCTTSGQQNRVSAYHAAPVAAYDTVIKTIHVMVALCDNRYQGIVPVPAKIGNGQDPDNNLYWGCAYGVRSFFSKSKEWSLIQKYKLNDTLLERVVFFNRKKNYYLVADAYNGKHIKQCTETLLESSAGIYSDTVHAGNKVLGIGGHARLLCYVGHDGLMDFKLDRDFERRDKKKRDLMILACYSKRFFSGPVVKTGADPLLWSTGLMSPEAYTLHDAIAQYMDDAPVAAIRLAAAKAYALYQKCSGKAALHLLVSGY